MRRFHAYCGTFPARDSVSAIVSSVLAWSPTRLADMIRRWLVNFLLRMLSAVSSGMAYVRE